MNHNRQAENGQALGASDTWEGTTMTTTARSGHDAAWRDCRPGELTQLQSQHRRQKRRAVLRQLAAAAAGTAAAGVLGIAWLQHAEQPHAPGGIACEEMTELLSAFARHQLDAGRTARIEKHLAVCEHCRERLAKLQQASL
jgi:phage protein D